MKSSLFVLIPILALAAGPAAAKGKPEWAVKGTCSEFPRERYMLGVGLADNEAAAKERARSEISKIFRTEVSATLESSMSETTRGKGDKTERSFSVSAQDHVRTATQEIQEGVELVDQWQDPATRVYYSLAAVEREKAKAILGSKIEDLDRQAQEYSSQLDAASEKLPRIKAAMRFLALLKSRETLNDKYRVVDPQGKPSPFNIAQVKAEANKAIAGLEVYVDFQCAMKDLAGAKRDECGDEVETGIVKGLNSFGFEAQTAAAPAEMDIVVQGKVTTSPLKGDRSGEWKWARSTVTVSLKDGRSGKTIQRFDETDRQASGDYDEAARRSRVSLARKVAQKVRQATTEYFENQ
ncbi:MAG: LPP20 family lipoprotein [Elusimicrobia bacterium]|nr:LPP20 family lipoprotein [Elusimicrobiota bacterium]